MKTSKFVLLAIVFLAFVLRLYRIDNPVADWHSWRQADTAAVSRNFVKFGFDLLHPRFDDLSNIPSGQENPDGYRFVEFPIYNVVHAFLGKTFSFWSFEIWGRLVSILSSLASLIFLYLVVKKYINERTALLAAFFFAVLPFNIYYSRAILPEAMMISLALAAICFFERSWLVSAIFGALALLVKPFAIFLIAPAILYLAIKNKSNFIVLLFYCFIVSLPFGLWRWLMNHFPEGIPANDWLLNANNIRFKGAFFYWLFGERIGKLILGYWGAGLLVLGLARKPEKKEGWFFFSWLVGILAYFFVFAAGNVQHDYYQVLAAPMICVFLAKGADLLLNSPEKYFNKLIGYLALTICVLFSLAFSWYYVRDFFNINNRVIVEAGQAADKLLPLDAKVIAPYGGDTAFLYQTNRRGWPVGIEIEKFIKLGATHYVNVNFGPETDWLMANYQVLEKTPEYVIIQLK